MRTFLLSLLCLANAPVDDGVNSRTTNEALLASITFCMSATTQDNISVPIGFLFYQDVPANAAAFFSAEGHLTTAIAPPLVRRYAATSTSGRFGGANYLNAPLKDGSIWVVFNGRVRGACDIMVTGVRGSKDLAGELTADLSASAKWQPRLASGSESAPFRTMIYTQAAPLPDHPARGWRLKVQSLRPDLARADGVQMDISVLAGDLKGALPAAHVR